MSACNLQRMAMLCVTCYLLGCLMAAKYELCMECEGLGPMQRSRHQVGLGQDLQLHCIRCKHHHTFNCNSQVLALAHI